MGIDHKHRKSEDAAEIRKVLNEVFFKDHVLKIWQSQDGAIRKVIEAIIDDFDLENKLLTFKNLKDAPFDFLPDSIEGVYFRCEHQFLTFKAAKFHQEDNFLFIKIPNVVHLKENRTEARKVYDRTNLPKTTIIIRRGSMKPIELEVSCLDISKNAMALSLSSSNIHQVYEGEEVKITKFEEVDTPLHLVGEISYIVEQKGNSQSPNYRVVVMFGPKSKGKLLDLI